MHASRVYSFTSSFPYRLGKICDRLHGRETRGYVGAGPCNNWKVYVLTLNGLAKVLPYVCEQRTQEGFDRVLLASCTVGTKDWNGIKDNGRRGKGKGLFLLCLLLPDRDRCEQECSPLASETSELDNDEIGDAALALVNSMSRRSSNQASGKALELIRASRSMYETQEQESDDGEEQRETLYGIR